MENFEKTRSIDESVAEIETKPVFRAVKESKEKQILAHYTAEQQSEIKHKQQILSSLAYFIGKDFSIPVKLNQPGEGWHWDFEKNIIRIDPQDLLDKPMDYLRFVISHEGGHRRISRTDFIPVEQWQEPGFAFMMNAIEDPRDNNFVAESYPKFKEQMGMAYEQDLDFEAKAKDKATDELGYKPRFMQAGFEYIKQWFKETKGEDFELSNDLPDDVKDVVNKTLAAAQDSWWRYPSRQEADNSEDTITQYAKKSYEINRDKVWPSFKGLIAEDMKDQQMQEMMQDSQSQGEGGSGQGLPQELKDKLTPEEQQQLEDAIKEAIEKQEQKNQEQQGEQGAEGESQEQAESSKEQGGSKGAPVNLDSLSEELKQNIKDYIESLPEDVKQELEKRAQKALGEFEKELNEELQGKLSQNPEQKVEKETKKETTKVEQSTESLDSSKTEKAPRHEIDKDEIQKYRDMLAKEMEKDANVYEEYRREVLPIIDKLEQDLRNIFVARRAKGWESGHKSGKRIDIKRRIQEKAKDVPAMESRAWQKRELPQEKDYAITLLVDLSGSMQGEKIDETFKAVIVLTEVLNRLSLNLEVLGFNDRMHEYQNFGQPISKEIREQMGNMLDEVDSHGASWNDDGWALEQASERLAKQKVDQKFLIVLSDGSPVPSSRHSGPEYDLGKMVKRVLKETDQKLIGLGIGSGTGHVANYYPNSMADVDIEEMATKLADLIEEVIANYNNF
jgi:cobalamin biosynthesis protein CobT